MYREKAKKGKKTRKVKPWESSGGGSLTAWRNGAESFL